MKTLYILRHAKSEPGSDSDHERELSERGVDACGLIGSHLKAKGIIPSRIVCSTAARARGTIGHIAVAAGWRSENPPIEFDADFYMASAGELLAIARRIDAESDSLMLVGHNPGMEELARTLVGRGEPTALATFAGKYSTGALATIVFDLAHWGDIGQGLGTLSSFVKPRVLA